MMYTKFDYDMIPVRHRRYFSTKNLFLLLGVLLVVAGLNYSNFIVATVGMYIGLIGYVVSSFFENSYLSRFSARNELTTNIYPHIKYDELPFVNKIYGVASVGGGIELQRSPLVELFHYSKTIGGVWSYSDFIVLHIALPRPLPNVMVDASSNDKWFISDMPASYRDFTNHYELEGDFPEYFKVYAHEDKAVETLQLLSPDVMVTLIDNFASFNIEFINRSVFITTRASLVKRSNFKILVEQSLLLAGDLQHKSRKILRTDKVYNERITRS